MEREKANERPEQQPKAAVQAGQKSYVLTLHTSSGIHKSMNQLRQEYFPRRLNKIPAHITLFHALPEDVLESHILPALDDLTANTKPYHIKAVRPNRLRKGIAIEVKDTEITVQQLKAGATKLIHDDLRSRWRDFLSDQDLAGIRMHYTVMNKVNDQAAVSQALTEIEDSLHNSKQSGEKVGKSSSTGVKHNSLELHGTANGLTLWSYEPSGHWSSPKQFPFAKST